MQFCIQNAMVYLVFVVNVQSNCYQTETIGTCVTPDDDTAKIVRKLTKNLRKYGCGQSEILTFTAHENQVYL